MNLKGLEIVEKRNVLNEVKKNDMTLQELRFFSIYLSKINARDISTRKVKFKLEEFQKIMELGRMNIQSFKDTVKHLLQKVVEVPRENDQPGYRAFQLFKKCEVYPEERDSNQWYVEIDAHDDALPLMFEFKEKYFTYELWNALRLNSRNQLRMYELLKQYEPIGMREIRLDQLKDWLGMFQGTYPMFAKFKLKVLEPCKKALLENTDIKYDYELMKTGRKVTGIRFIIKTNKDYEDPLCLSEFIDSLSVNEPSEDELDISNPYDELIESLSSLCNHEFDREKVIVINDLLLKMGYCKESNMQETYDYLLDKYHELNANKKIPKTATERRFGYLKWLMKFDLSEYMSEN